MNKVMKELLNTAIYLLCVLGAVWLVITFVGQRTEVEGASMENTLHNGDNLIVDKLSYRFHDPNVLTSLSSRFNIRQTHIISNVSSDCRERRYRSWMMAVFTSTAKKLEENYGKRSHKTGDDRAGRRNPLNWGMTSILSWEITGIIPATVVRIW